MLRSLFGARSTQASRKPPSTRLSRLAERSRRSWCFRALESLEDRALFAMAGVDVFNSSFLPNPVTVHVGDTVQWVWDSNGFSTTSVAGNLEQWNSGIHDAGFTFEHTFTHVGTFDYYSTAGGVDN